MINRLPAESSLIATIWRLTLPFDIFRLWFISDECEPASFHVHCATGSFLRNNPFEASNGFNAVWEVPIDMSGDTFAFESNSEFLCNRHVPLIRLIRVCVRTDSALNRLHGAKKKKKKKLDFSSSTIVFIVFYLIEKFIIRASYVHIASEMKWKTFSHAAEREFRVRSR